MSHTVGGMSRTHSSVSFPEGSLVFVHRACASSETESEAGDIMEQQLEEMNKQLNSVTDPTGFLRMLRHNNLLHRYGAGPEARVLPCFTGHRAWCPGYVGELQRQAWCVVLAPTVQTEVGTGFPILFDMMEPRDVLPPCQL